MADHLKKAGLIGTGSVSDWHVRAFRLAGFEIAAVSSRKGSKTVLPFAEKHRIPRAYPSWESMLKERGAFDALVIAAHVEGTVEILSGALELGIPIFVEKPVALSSVAIEKLCRQAHPCVQVGYNRRFYPSVLFAREWTQAGGPAIAGLFFPENLFYGPQKGQRDYLYRFFQNSCHGTDMLRFIFGDLKIEKVKGLLRSDKKWGGFSALLSTSRGDVINFIANWGTPANLSLTIDWPGRRIELKPIEKAWLYEGMEVIEPATKFPLRQYRPKVAEEIGFEKTDGIQKPGFVEQATAFKELMERGKRHPFAATLEDAYGAVKLCEDLVARL